MFRRLCSRAPRTTSLPLSPAPVTHPGYQRTDVRGADDVAPFIWCAPAHRGTTGVMPVRPHVVIVGSGFGGLNAASRLARQPVDITVVDRDNYHGFWPLLYQVATAGLGPDDIAHPIRGIYASHPNISVRMATVTDVDLDHRLVRLEDGDTVAYDYLIMAAGTSTSDFGIP